MKNTNGSVATAVKTETTVNATVTASSAVQNESLHSELLAMLRGVKNKESRYYGVTKPQLKPIGNTGLNAVIHEIRDMQHGITREVVYYFAKGSNKLVIMGYMTPIGLELCPEVMKSFDATKKQVMETAQNQWALELKEANRRKKIAATIAANQEALAEDPNAIEL